MLLLLTRLRRFVARSSEIAFGSLLALFVCGWSWGFAAQFGTSWESRFAGLACGLLGLGTGLLLRRRFVEPKQEWMPRAWLAGLSVIAPFWIPFVAHRLAGVPLATWASTTKSLGLLTGAGLATLFLPAVLGGLSLPHDARRTSQTLLGCGLGLFVFPSTLVAFLGLDVAVLTAAVLCGVGIALRRIEETEPAVETTDAPVTVSPLWLGGLLAAGGAVLMAVSGRWSFQMFLDAPCWVLARWAGLCCGAAAGLTLVRWTPRSALRLAALALGSAAALAVVAFPQFLEATLSINATISWLWSALILRGLVAALLPFVSGLAIAAGCAAVAPRRASVPAAVAFAAFLIGMTLSAPAAGLVLAALCGTAAALVATYRTPAPTEHEFPAAALLRQGLAWGPMAAVCVLAVWSAAAADRYAPAVAARVLFNAPFITAWLNGQPIDNLLHADSTRLLSTIESRDSTWTVWKQRDAYVQLRENGLPRSMVCLDTNIAPQSAPEVVATVLPLVVHRDPQSILFLGMNSPASLATTLQFPIFSIRCIERDPAIRQIIETQLEPNCQTSIFRDERVQWESADPFLAARSTHDRTYDVIVAQDGQSMPWRSAPRWTRDHFRSVAALLGETGLFCQRMNYGDVTDRPVREVAATLRNAFAHVTIVEPLPGELLFLCSNAEPVVLNEHLMSRLDKGHVRHTLGRMGWDWSVVMGLSYIPADVVDEFIDEAPVNSATNARFVTTLPQEVYCWGAKWNAVKMALASCSTTAIRRFEKESAELFDVSKRFEDIQLASKIVGAHPDEFWEYRKSLRDRLKDRPRTAIVQVQHEGLQYGLHAEDARRKEYLIALGKAASAEQPTIALVSEMAAFAEPFDPLLSPFVHEEAARLYGKCAEPAHEAAFNHWRHAVYYGTGQDRSVRNVVSAVQTLHDHPESVPDPLQRWDALQSLLEVMRERWIIRAQLARTNKSKFEAVDLSRSIAAAEAAIDDLDALAREVGPAAEGWEMRKKIIERDLIRDLEGYRSIQTARADAEKRSANTPPPGTVR